MNFLAKSREGDLETPTAVIQVLIALCELTTITERLLKTIVGTSDL
ncbi:Unannotated [Lentimonas sp. CC19]|nr:Unannotated [Lentimonas sp. CC10]CAA6693128.1 Unannotated [Lentimonas sp. CC19]CAA7068990.1 Unannotated [Lentimonas sp. CC11]